MFFFLLPGIISPLNITYLLKGGKSLYGAITH